MNQPTDDSDPTTVVADTQSTVQMYSPAMMAEMLRVPVRAIRLWHRAGLLVPTQVIMKIPYFDYSVLSTANTLARWFHHGVSAQSVVKQLVALGKLRTDHDATISDLPISLNGKRLVLSQGDLQVEANGQFQLSFEDSDLTVNDEPVTFKFATGIKPEHLQQTSDLITDLLEAAAQAEDDGNLDQAAEGYRTVLAQFGPIADVCFQLAEVLYRQVDLSGARERYCMAIELEPTFVEARANLGCVLAECGQFESALSVFAEALQQYPDYADVHFHLARVLDDMGRKSEALEHWRRFIQLAPASPWADEAAVRLSEARGSPFERAEGE